jgi:hypothetical protein
VSGQINRNEREMSTKLICPDCGLLSEGSQFSRHPGTRDGKPIQWIYCYFCDGVSEKEDWIETDE